MYRASWKDFSPFKLYVRVKAVTSGDVTWTAKRRRVKTITCTSRLNICDNYNQRLRTFPTKCSIPEATINVYSRKIIKNEICILFTYEYDNFRVKKVRCHELERRLQCSLLHASIKIVSKSSFMYAKPSGQETVEVINSKQALNQFYSQIAIVNTFDVARFQVLATTSMKMSSGLLHRLV